MHRVAILLSVAAAIAAQPVRIAESPTFTEGAVFDYEGYLYFSHRDGIDRLTPRGEQQAWVRDPEAGFNGHKVLPDGTHLVCASKKSQIWRLDADGRRIGIASSECEGKPLRAPNDITLDTHGGFYFSDPGGSREQPIGTVHYVDRGGRTLLSAGGMRVPNGLVLNPDGKYLYVAETVPNRILRMPVNTPGTLGRAEVFAMLPSRSGAQAEPDGLAMDTDGNLYVAHLAMSVVEVISPAGKLIRSIPAGVYDVSNLAFGGPGNRSLFITGAVGHRSNTAGRVFRVDLESVRGISSLLPRGPAYHR